MSPSNSKVFDFAAHEESVDKLIKSSFSRPFMSDAKWRKVFRALDSSCPDLQVIWKFVGSKNEGARHALPSSEALSDRYLNSRFWFGPAYYKEIEWVEFPRKNVPLGKENIPGAHRAQDISVARACIEALGSFELAESELGFRLYGYGTEMHNNSLKSDAAKPRTLG